MGISFFKIRINSLQAQTPVPFDVYLYINNHYTLYIRAGDQLKMDKMEALHKKRPDGFFIPLEAKEKYKAFIHDQIKSDLEASTKATILRESSIALVEDLFENPDVHEAIEDSKSVIDNFIELTKSSDAMKQLVSLSGHDFYTYTHSLNVSIYSFGLGQIIGLPMEQLKILGLGALLHDLGKRYIDLNIITKRGPLSDLEWSQIQRHPQFGLIILNEHENVDPAVKACCFEHHEGYGGNGYPQNLHGEQIHPFARIIAIADTYDAMTTQRSYNVPKRPAEALKMMKEQLQKRFDPEFLKAMCSVLFHSVE